MSKESQAALGEPELRARVERLYAEYIASNGPPPERPPDFPPDDDAAARKRLFEAEREVIQHVAWYGELPKKLTVEQMWLLESMIAIWRFAEDAAMRLTHRAYKAIAHELFGKSVELTLKNAAAARRRGVRISEEAVARRKTIKAAAKEYRSEHPQSEKWTKTRMARDLSAQLRIPLTTVKRHLKQLKIR